MEKQCEFTRIMDEVDSGIERYKSEIEKVNDPVVRQKLIGLLQALQAADEAMHDGLVFYDESPDRDWKKFKDFRRAKTEQFLSGIAG